jgi:tetratricopeptide (TPR) repeat protein
MFKNLLFASLFLFSANLFGQENPNNENFNEAKVHLANHKLNQAIPILEKLWSSDQTNANLNYLLGLCYVKEDKSLDKAVELLETASNIYTTDYSASSGKERRAPEYVYYYLTIAYSKTGQCEEALRSLNKFYQVYSYSDEYYLVDGQKWVRECNVAKKEKTEIKIEEKQPELAEAETPAAEEPVVEEPKIEETPLVEKPEVALAVEPVVEETKPAEPIATQEEPTFEEENAARKAIVAEVLEEKLAPKIKERLIPFNDWEDLRTREVSFTSLNSQYGIQVAALVDLRPTREFDNLKNVEVYVDENGTFRYVVGRFLYRQQAESLLSKIREQGYEDAFIVDINQPYYNKEVLGVGPDNIDWHLDGKVDFRVQIGAFRSIVSEAVAEKYLSVEGIRETQQNSLTILTVGSFRTYEEAAAYRETLKAEGIVDAFVVAFNRGNKVSVKDAKDFVEKENQPETDAPKEGGTRRKKSDF